MEEETVVSAASVAKIVKHQNDKVTLLKTQRNKQKQKTFIKLEEKYLYVRFIL